LPEIDHDSEVLENQADFDDPAEAGAIVERESDDLKKQIIRYCDAFPEHAGNLRHMIQSCQ